MLAYRKRTVDEAIAHRLADERLSKLERRISVVKLARNVAAKGKADEAAKKKGLEKEVVWMSEEPEMGNKRGLI